MSAPSRDDGSTVAELVITAPVLLLALMFLVLAGRLATARLDVAEAAHSAARAASLASTPQQATVEAARITATIPEIASCSRRESHADTAAFHPGGVVKVTVTCRIRLRDITGLVPGTTSISQTSVSPVDPFKATG
jgi:Flp pilus assembly protein TadG